MALNKSYCSPFDRRIWDFPDLETNGSVFPSPIVPTPKLTTFVDIMPGEYLKINGALSTYVLSTYDTYNFYAGGGCGAPSLLTTTKIHLDQSYLPYA